MDDFDRLFDFGPEEDVPPPKKGRDGNDSDGLGIDEAVTVKAKREPRMKLDEALLISDKGVPQLQRIMKKQLRLKGKGHEFTDVTRMLNLYQVWLDEMFPSVKFVDGLDMVEKVGHTRKMQIVRQEWLNQGRPKPTVFLPDDDDDGDDGAKTRTDSPSFPMTGEQHATAVFNTIFGSESRAGGAGDGAGGARAGTASINSLPSASRTTRPDNYLQPNAPSSPAIYSDNMVDIAGDSGFMINARSDNTIRPTTTTITDQDDIPDDDELEALLQQEPSSTTNNPVPTQASSNSTMNTPGRRKQSEYDDYELEMLDDFF